MAQTIVQEKGTRADWLVTLKHETNADLTYDGSEALSCTVWAGDDRAVLCEPTVTWEEAPDQVTVSIEIADIADLDPGKYKIRILVAGSIHGASGILEIRPGPGDATAVAVYCSAEDLRRKFGRIDELQDENDRAGFEEQRALARQWLDRTILANYRPRGFDMRYDSSYGSTLGANPVLKGWLDANQLLVDDDVRQACAHYALHLIFDAQIDGKPAGDGVDYERLSARHLSRAEQRLGGMIAEIDLNNDGIGEVQIPLFGIQAGMG